MQTITVRVFDINVVDELNNEEYIIYNSCLYYDAVVDKIIEVIALFNTNIMTTKLLMYEETLGGAAEMDFSFWEELKTAIKEKEVVLLEGNQQAVESILWLNNSVLSDLPKEVQ